MLHPTAKFGAPLNIDRSSRKFLRNVKMIMIYHLVKDILIERQVKLLVAISAMKVHVLNT